MKFLKQWEKLSRDHKKLASEDAECMRAFQASGNVSQRDNKLGQIQNKGIELYKTFFKYAIQHFEKSKKRAAEADQCANEAKVKVLKKRKRLPAYVKTIANVLNLLSPRQ